MYNESSYVIHVIILKSEYYLCQYYCFSFILLIPLIHMPSFSILCYLFHIGEWTNTSTFVLQCDLLIHFLVQKKCIHAKGLRRLLTQVLIWTRFDIISLFFGFIYIFINTFSFYKSETISYLFLCLVLRFNIIL